MSKLAFRIASSAGRSGALAAAAKGARFFFNENRL
jgi:hypothetical protein